MKHKAYGESNVSFGWQESTIYLIMCEIHSIEKFRRVPCDRIQPITLLSYIPHTDIWGDARSQQKSETVAITYNHHRCKRHFISLFPFSWLQENFPTTRKREITSLLGLSLGDATSQAMSAKSRLQLFWELSTNSRTGAHHTLLVCLYSSMVCHSQNSSRWVK